MYDRNNFDIYQFYNRGSGKGTLITVPFFEDEPERNCFSIDDIEKLNIGINEHNIFIAPDPVGGAGGAGGVYIPPETLQVFQIIIRDLAIEISASLLCNGLKEAIKRMVKYYQEKKGLQKDVSWQILHNQESISIIVVNGEVDDKILDSSLRTLLTGTILRDTHDFPSTSDQGLG